MARLPLILATVSVGLFAGFCFCYTVAITRGLAHLDDQQYVTAMRRLNDAVPSVPFLLVLGGSVVWPLVAFALASPRHPAPRTWLIAAAAVCCLAAFAVTVAGNVPLNGRLAAAVTHDAAGFHRARESFEHTWNVLHLVRTLLSGLAFALLVGACLPHSRQHAPASATSAATSAGAPSEPHPA
ncbi:anthrone oxygenase family protein [Actinomadura harenae]|uniref:DUF1772 domain-containing protein n=1 Tax=Actinomadura harenae TaxID=2483351 RepID=A0A3M2LNF1_9ACTN|nr:DUF1772 domain-containing protein [Actinomadura harenae]RMI36318.1 DUF1772 domain-containing protein [Actinomadura harenae]